jgi:hypothetical protein
VRDEVGQRLLFDPPVDNRFALALEPDVPPEEQRLLGVLGNIFTLLVAEKLQTPDAAVNGLSTKVIDADFSVCRCANYEPVQGKVTPMVRDSPGFQRLP